jgi:hypothetical protein
MVSSLAQTGGGERIAGAQVACCTRFGEVRTAAVKAARETGFVDAMSGLSVVLCGAPGRAATGAVA